MLLELIDHSEGLFAAVLEHLVEARDCHTLGALGATNRRIWAAILALPMRQHWRKMKGCSDAIKAINILRNEFITIRDFNNDVVVYSYYTYEQFVSADLADRCYVHRHNKQSYIIMNSMNGYERQNIIRQSILISINNTTPRWLGKYKSYIFCTTGMELKRYMFNV
jgi:hypothetical protein